MDAARARTGLAIFFPIVIAITGAVQWTIYRRGGAIESHIGLVFLLMWSPAIASLVARLALREGIRDISFRFGKRALPMMGLAVLFPIVVGLLAYGGAWLTGLASFHDAPIKLFGIAPSGRASRFLFRLLLSATIGVPISALSAAGEELGWRGYMLTRLIDARAPRPVLLSALIWGAWHTPLILTGQYAAGPYPALSALVFMLSILPSAYLTAYVRLRSGSVWPAVVAHAGWNAVIQGVFDAHTQGGGASRTTSIWIGESGLLTAAVSLLIALVLLRGVWTMRRNPRDEDEPLSTAVRL